MAVAYCQKLFRAAGILIVVGVLAACASAPVQQMSDARQAIAAARQAGAEQAAPAELNRATRYLQLAEQALRRHDFSNARASAREAKQAAADALELSLGMGNSSGLEPDDVPRRFL